MQALAELALECVKAKRERAVRALSPDPGHNVLDLACRTGLSLAGLRRSVGRPAVPRAKSEAYAS